MYWVDECVKKVLDHKTADKYVCAAGITPSGIVHVGNLRDALTSELVYRGLIEQNKTAEFIWSWDDYDRLRKIPKDVPEEFSKYIGMPVYKIPDPYGCHESYAEHFEKDVEGELAKVGVHPRFIYQHKMYLENRYFPLIKIALQKRKHIAKILSEFKAQDKSEEQIENYYPLQVYCESCERDFTTITGYDEENTVSYECKCGHRASADISKKNIGKLVWKVDWPMRWVYENVSFEPGGKDHSTPGGSFDVSSKIAKEVFNFEPPIYQPYEFIGIVGMGGKMSSSVGNVVKIADLNAVYEPEITRWFYARVRPLQAINFAFDQQIIKNYAEFDEFTKRLGDGSATDEEQRIGYFTRVDSDAPLRPNGLSFRQLASFAQLTKGNEQELKKLLQKAGSKVSDEDFNKRSEKAYDWTEQYAPDEFRITLLSEKNITLFESLDEAQKSMIKDLVRKLDDCWDEESLTNLLYDIPKKFASQDELKQAQRDFFKNIYALMIGQATGPRLASFFLALGKNKVKELLEF